MGGHLTGIMIADEEANEQEEFLPVQNCIFDRVFGKIYGFISKFDGKSCKFDVFHGFWALKPLIFGRKSEEFLPIPGKKQ